MGVEEGHTGGNQGSRSDLAQEGRVVLLCRPEVGTGLVLQRNLEADRAQIVDDVGTVTEQQIEIVGVASSGNRLMHKKMEAIQGICSSLLHEQVEQSRYRDDAQQSDGEQPEVEA